MTTHLNALDALLARLRSEFAHAATPESAAALRAQMHALTAAKAALAPPPLEFPRFPTILRRMWSGGEVQEWIDAHLAPLRAIAVEHARVMRLIRALREPHGRCGVPGARECAHCAARAQLEALAGVPVAPASTEETSA